MEELNLKLTITEVNTVLEAMGQLPYLRVYELITKIQMQAQEQLKNDQVKNNKEKSKVETN